MTKTRIIRIISLLIAMITLAFAVSCGASSCSCKGKKSNSTNNGNSPSDSADQDIQFESQTPDTEKPTVEKSTNEHGEVVFPDDYFGKSFDFENKELSILYRDNIQNSREWFKMNPEDMLDEQIAYIRNEVESRLKLQVVFKPIASNGIGNDLGDYKSRFHNELMDDVLSGKHEYDISANMACYTASPVIRNYAANLLDAERFPSFDFSYFGYFSSFAKENKINGKLFYMVLESSTSILDATPVVWYNHAIYDKLREDNDPDSLQKIALLKKWTYDELYKLVSASYDGFDGVGLIVNKNDLAPLGSIPHSWDLGFIVTNPNGSHSFNISGNEKAKSAFEKLTALLDCEITSTNATITSFVEGRAMFYMDVICRSPEDNRRILEMEDPFALLPMPKYDEQQKNYLSTPDDFYTLILVPDHKSNTDGELISTFLQGYNYFACDYSSLIDIYLREVADASYFGITDDDVKVSRSWSATLLQDHIIPGIRFDFASVYSPQLNDLSYLWCEAIERREYPSQVFEEYKEMFDAALKNTDEWLRS